MIKKLGVITAGIIFLLSTGLSGCGPKSGDQNVITVDKVKARAGRRQTVAGQPDGGEIIL